ncbi:hypothetical protein [Streptomyces plumbiresistens]|uniref:Uncharacterized protein n=1 Tax=Streptomyces plumbiresistens TaxID=511811 RepID=A0ABP7TE56_9ACTN
MGVFALGLPCRAAEFAFDYHGFALMAAAVTRTVLVAEWGGTDYAWSDPVTLGMATGGLFSTRLISSSLDIWCAPGRVDSPPTSTMSAAAVTSSKPRSVVNHRPREQIGGHVEDAQSPGTCDPMAPS